MAEKGARSVKGTGDPDRMAEGNIKLGNIQTASAANMGPEDFSEGVPLKKTSLLSNSNAKYGPKG